MKGTRHFQSAPNFCFGSSPRMARSIEDLASDCAPADAFVVWNTKKSSAFYLGSLTTGPGSAPFAAWKGLGNYGSPGAFPFGTNNWYVALVGAGSGGHRDPPWPGFREHGGPKPAAWGRLLSRVYGLQTRL